jgi:hypothetical protein
MNPLSLPRSAFRLQPDAGPSGLGLCFRVMSHMTTTARDRLRAAYPAHSDRKTRRTQILSLIARLPEAVAITQGRDLSLEVRGRRFALFVEVDPADRRPAVNFRAGLDEARLLRASHPERFHIVKSRSKSLWVGMWLDIGEVDWALVGELLADAYRLTAPRVLLRRLWESG